MTKKILIVEDDELVQLVIAAHLEELGFGVEMAATAAEAKSKVSGQVGALDAAIVDMGLPDAKGDALVGELRMIEPAIPILISSGHDRAKMRQMFLGTTNLAYLTKPYTQEELRGALHGLGISP